MLIGLNHCGVAKNSSFFKAWQDGFSACMILRSPESSCLARSNLHCCNCITLHSHDKCSYYFVHPIHINEGTRNIRSPVVFCILHYAYQKQTENMVQNNISAHSVQRLLLCSCTRLPSIDDCHSLKFGECDSLWLVFCSCHSPQSFPEPAGGLWASLTSAAVFFPFFLCVLAHSAAVTLSEKKNGAENKYPQTASLGWLDCWYFGPLCKCVVYCCGSVFSEV